MLRLTARQLFLNISSNFLKAMGRGEELCAMMISFSCKVKLNVQLAKE